MIEAGDFVEAARQCGFDWYSGVPCSYLTPFINYVLQDDSLRYVSAANEGDAVAYIAGVTLAGGRGISMMQNSGLGNAVSPLTSLTWTFRLPQLLIVTWRGQPGVADEPQHALMGPITPQVLQAMEIPWELFPSTTPMIAPVLDRASSHMQSSGRPYALVMQKSTVAPYVLKTAVETGAAGTPTSTRARQQQEFPSAALGNSHIRASRRDALRVVIDHTPVESTLVLASTGFCGRELYALADRPNQLYMVGSMGCVVPLALGVAMARPDLRVVALDGDGAALMRMGAFATVGAYGPPNLQHLLLDNGVHDSTGGQATVSGHLSFAAIAHACGYAAAIETDDVDRLGAWLDAAPIGGPRFARVLIRSGTPDGLPRPDITPVEVAGRLMRHVAALRGAYA
jgi:phosphonopyruvate decarboxylase